MPDLNPFQITVLILGFVVLPVLAIWATIAAFKQQKNNMDDLVAHIGWKREPINSNTIQKRFSSSANGIDWILDFGIPEYQEETLQLLIPTLLAWHTSSVKLASGRVVIALMYPDFSDCIDLYYQIWLPARLKELDIKIDDGLSPQQVEPPVMQDLFSVLADSKENAQIVLDSAKKQLMRWPMWDGRDAYIPKPVILADTEGISVRVPLQLLDLKTYSRTENGNNPFFERILKIVQIGVETAAGIRDLA